MKKIKITKEQFNRITNLLKESFPVLKKNPNPVDKAFKTEIDKRVIKNLGEDTNFDPKKNPKIKNVPPSGIKAMGKFMKESTGDLKQETLDFINYLYNKNEDLPSYDEICKELESKGIVINVDGKYKLSKSLGSAEEAKQAVENELAKMMGGDKEEIEEEVEDDLPRTRPTINVNNLAFETLKIINGDDIAILTDNNGTLYALNLADLSEKDKNTLSDELGFTEGEFDDRDEDGQPDFIKYYGWQNNEEEEKQIIAAYGDSLIDELGHGLEDFNNHHNLVTFDEPLKNELLDFYSQNPEIITLLSGENQSNEPLSEEESEEEKRAAKIKASLALTRKKSQDWDAERFAARDKQNAIDSAKAKAKLKLRKEPEPKPEPKKPIGQYRMQFDKDDREIDEMNTGMAGATGQFTGKAGMVKREMPNVEVVKETMNATPSTTGEYIAPGLKMKKNHTDFAKSEPEAFKKAQMHGGSFVEFNDCVKLNNKPAGTGCSAGAVDGVVKQKKSKGNVSAPSLGENKIYETIAKKTGKTIDEVKRIIESKNNK